MMMRTPFAIFFFKSVEKTSWKPAKFEPSLVMGTAYYYYTIALLYQSFLFAQMGAELAK